jgi:hypothetical protein
LFCDKQLSTYSDRMMISERAASSRATSSIPSLELNETAYLLGYEDANSFFRVPAVGGHFAG